MTMTDSTKTPPALWALALGAFAIGMTEFSAIGVLNQVAADFTVSHAQAGWMVTAYAVGVMVGSPILTWLGLRLSRKTLLILSMALFTRGNALTTLSPWFSLMLVGRIVTSFSHGVFFGLGSVVGAELAGAHRRAAAVAFMFSGLTVANLVGVPLGAWVGDVLSWRVTYGFITVVGLGVMLALARLVPTLPTPAPTSLSDELRTLANPRIVTALAMTLLGFGGVFAAITYLAPMLTEVSGVANRHVTWFMVVLGLGMMVGNHFGGKWADRHLIASLVTELVLLTLSLVAFGFVLENVWLTALLLFAIGALGFATVAPLQTVTMKEAHTSPTLASVMNIGAFNLGNALAAWLGGLAIESSWGLPAAPWVGAVMSTVALGLTLFLAQKRQLVETPSMA